MSAEIINSSEIGTLKIKVPHWLVQVRIYNELSELEREINDFNESQSTEYFERDIELEPGIYEIEYILADKAERRLIIIRPGQNTDVLERKSVNWQSLQIGSPIPSENTTRAEIKYSEYTENQSTIKTKQTFSTESASIFLSVKIPGDYADLIFKDVTVNFQEIFDLKDEKGNSVINFNEDVKKSSEEACLIFNADLPHGFYFLEWINYIIRNHDQTIYKEYKCYQPVFIHRNWTTQVFVLTHTPSPNAFSLNMARYGMSFQKNDEEIRVAEAMLETLSQTAERSILTKEKMKFLLHHELQNPWLGILAAYALIPSDDLFFNEKILASSLFTDIRGFLKKELPDHPDVLALDLNLNEPAERPFYHPPLLKIGLRRVRRHAVKHESTIPYGALTDRVLDIQLVGGPWVSWEKQYKFAEINTSTNVSDSLADQVSQTQEIKTQSPVFVQVSSSAKLPVYQLSTDTEPNLSSDSSLQKTSQASTLQQASLLNLSQELSRAGTYQELPTQMNITPTATLVDFLNKAKSRDISAATNLPLSRINTALKNIIEKKEQLSFNENELTQDEQQIINYAFKEKSKEPGKKGQLNKLQNRSIFPNESGNSEEPLDSAVSGEVNTITIEECVSKLHAEANRLSAGLGKESNSLVNEKGKMFAERLIRVADDLLRRADFTVETDADGRIGCVNGAFLYLISSDPSHNLISEMDKKSKQKVESEVQTRNKLLWQRVINEAPLGNSKLVAPAANNYFDFWNLRKIELFDDEQKAVYGRLNILRGVDAPDCKKEIVSDVGKQLSRLSLHAPLFCISSSKNENPHEKNLEEIIYNLENATKIII